MASDSQRPESAVIPAVLECYQTKRNNDEQNRLLVNVPSEEKGRISAERDGANKGFPGGLEEESEKDRLKDVSRVMVAGWLDAYNLGTECEEKASQRNYVRKHGEGRVPN